ncbi:MAG TPA: SCO family protein [Vicinamibacterales bacterium]|nr:SCO family protein [Vicinamibacterales bacterium]
MRQGRSVIRAAIAAISLLVCASSPASAQDRHLGADYFPNVTLTTQDGVKVRFYDDLIKGKIVAINLIYTECKYACPLETARLAQVQKLIGDGMGREVFFYSISIDPEHDTPQVLKAYAETFHAGPGWLFLTGTREDVERISRKIGLYSAPNAANPDGHTPHLLVGNEVTGQWMRNSGVDDPRFLATTINTWMKGWRAGSQPLRSYAEAPPINLTAGQYTFNRHCAACHTLGGGDRIGPDLIGVTNARPAPWLTRFIAEPDVVRAEGDRTAAALSAKYAPAVMPRLGLSRADVDLLVGYIKERSETATPVVRAPAAAATVSPDVKSTPKPASASALTAILDPYLQIQRALNSDSLEGIADSARTIANAAKARGQSAESIRFAAIALDATNIAAARSGFARMSDAIIALTKQPGAALDLGVSVAYCPMLQKHWLQRDSKISNPYYGRQMSECGRFITVVGSFGEQAGTTPRRKSPSPSRDADAQSAARVH